jgi:hypothetical protein
MAIRFKREDALVLAKQEMFASVVLRNPRPLIIEPCCSFDRTIYDTDNLGSNGQAIFGARNNPG